MAVTKETYTATPTWTASGAAALFEDAFIDANLMMAWHDSFANGGVENRVLEVEYDGTKAYGTCYYWFVFTTTSIGVSVASDWNTGSNVPSGTQFLDYLETATNTTANHSLILAGANTATQLDVVRYTSSGNSDYSWFVVRNGSVPFPFLIAPASAPIVPWIDLDKTLFHHFVKCRLATSSLFGTASFNETFKLRRSYLNGYTLREITSFFAYNNEQTFLTYTAGGHQNGNPGNYRTLQTSAEILVPYGFSATNPEFSEDFTPVLKGCSFSPYLTEPLPLDMGVHFPFTSTAFGFGDRIVVSSGVEEWEVLNFVNTASADASNPLLVARVV